VYGVDGRALYYEGFVEDITERKRAEEALKESETRFGAIFENAAIGIALVDVHGHPVESNPALKKMLGYNKFELADMAFTEFTHPDDARADWDLFIELVEGKRDQYQMEKRFLRRDGQVVWGQLSVSLVRNQKGEFKYCIGMVEDISERRRTEEALRQLSGRLLRLQDEERRRMARELHETAAQSLAGLAVNLTLVKTLATDLNPRASACLSESLELAEQCSREIRTISYLLHPPLVDEAGLGPALGWYTAGFAQRSGIEVRVDVSPEFGRLPSEHELTLYRIVQEALTNIHLHSGSKTARICLERQPNEIVLTVADEGHGFPSAALGIAGPESSNIGVGIPGMRERLRQLGGGLHIQTGNRGTTLTAILPLGQVTNGQTTLSFGG
jgi:PAS domain S-box-containing protein